MNPFEELVLDEPPLQVHGPDLVVAGRRLRRRRRLAQAGLAVAGALVLGTAAAVVPWGDDAGQGLTVADEPLGPFSADGAAEAVGEALGVTLTDPVLRSGNEIVAARYDGSNVVLSSVPASQSPFVCAGTFSDPACRDATLPNGGHLLTYSETGGAEFSGGVNHGHTAAVTRPDGVVLILAVNNEDPTVYGLPEAARLPSVSLSMEQVVDAVTELAPHYEP